MITSDCFEVAPVEPASDAYDEDIPEVRTERLVLRAWRRADETSFAAMCADAEVTRFIDDGRPLSAPASVALLGRIRGHWRAYGFGLWPVELVETGAWVGCVGLRHAGLGADVEACWWLPAHAWRQGIATEAAAAAIRWGFETRRLPEILAMCHHANTGSKAVAARLGMGHVTTLRSSRGWPMEVFAIGAPGPLLETNSSVAGAISRQGTDPQ